MVLIKMLIFLLASMRKTLRNRKIWNVEEGTSKRKIKLLLDTDMIELCGFVENKNWRLEF